MVTGNPSLARTSVIMLIAVGLSMPVSSCKESKPDPSDKQVATTKSDENEFVPIFDGKSLAGWQGDSDYWRVEDGKLVGEVTPTTLLKTNTFIRWQGGQPADFELKLEFRITTDGNSGINYRSELLDTIPNALRGYQADIDGKNTYTGQNYEERKRTTLAYRGEQVLISSQPEPEAAGSMLANISNNAWKSREVVSSLGDPDYLKGKINSEAWNSCHLVIKGNKLQH